MRKKHWIAAAAAAALLVATSTGLVTIEDNTRVCIEIHTLTGTP